MDVVMELDGSRTQGFGGIKVCVLGNRFRSGKCFFICDSFAPLYLKIWLLIGLVLVSFHLCWVSYLAYPNLLGKKALM
jgi:hypothetical protein